MFKSVKTFTLLAAMGGLLVVAGQYFAQGTGATIMVFIALAMNIGMYFFSAKLAIRSARAVPMDEATHADVYAIVRNLSLRADQPMPKMYMSPSPQLNAFATGRNPDNAAVCVNAGLYDALSAEELEGVLGHELQHVYNRDILIGTVAAGIATIISYLAVMARWGAMFSGGGGDRDNNRNPIALIVASIVAPLAATVIQLAVTRSRESLADKTGAELTGNPMGLARALAKLEAGSKDPRRLRAGGVPAETNGAMQHMYISAPFGGKATSKLFSSHPPISERIEALGEQARAMGQLGPNESVFDRL
jgi:heat shock protein HtpX